MSTALAAYRERLEAEKITTPLWVYLYIYTKSKSCYISYMEGAIALYKYLSPIEIPTCYDEEKLPTYLFGYETDQIATILAGEGMLVRTCQQQKIENAIVHTTFKEVLPRLQAKPL